MKPCEYWWTDANVEWCDLTNSQCTCRGATSQCPLSGKAIEAALREQERITLEQLAMRARRTRKDAEAV
ncbi:MAG: hypothetical protein QHI38_07085 [Armatimonadota bacterium]|nr:hypothetical protein [Armatimonadota bacterium]